MLMYLKHYSSIVKICSILLPPEHKEEMEILPWDADVKAFYYTVMIVLYGCVVLYQRWL